MKKIEFPPWFLVLIGVSISVLSLVIKGHFDLFILAFWLIAATVEVFARKQTKVPSMVITFIVSIAVIVFVRTNVITYKKVLNSSAEPYINKGAAVFYQPNFYSIKTNDLIIIKNYEDSHSLICRVLETKGQDYKLEIVSRRKVIETGKNNIEGKIIYTTAGEGERAP